MHGNELKIDPLTISWRRVVDLNDRAMREIVNGLGGKLNGIPRQTGYDITVASEVMAILGLATSLKDLRERLGRITFGYSTEGKPLTADDIGAGGAMTVLLKDALKPNLMQTLEGNPALVHAGPFANIAQGNNSIIADKVALKLGRLRGHRERLRRRPGRREVHGHHLPLRRLRAQRRGHHLHHARPQDARRPAGRPRAAQGREQRGAREGLREPRQADREHEALRHPGRGDHQPLRLRPRHRGRDRAQGGRWRPAPRTPCRSTCTRCGGDGGQEAAEVVKAAADKGGDFKFLYPLEASIKEKIETIATKIYGADGVDYLPEAEAKIKLFTEQGLDKLPLCMAKTHLSLSHDPNLKGRPRGFRVPIRDIRPATGAGYLYPLLGEMRTMPGLPKRPAAVDVDIDVETGRIIGLF